MNSGLQTGLGIAGGGLGLLGLLALLSKYYSDSNATQDSGVTSRDLEPYTPSVADYAGVQDAAPASLVSAIAGESGAPNYRIPTSSQGSSAKRSNGGAQKKAQASVPKTSGLLGSSFFSGISPDAVQDEMENTPRGFMPPLQAEQAPSVVAGESVAPNYQVPNSKNPMDEAFYLLPELGALATNKVIGFADKATSPLVGLFR